jgi:hypothetical protein
MFDFGGPFFGWIAGIGFVLLGIIIAYGIMRQRKATPREHAAGEEGAHRLYQRPEPLDPDHK